MAKRKTVATPPIQFELSKSGMGIIRINTDTYLSFGSANPVKYVSIRIPNDGRLFPVAMKKLPKPYTNEIGVKNIKRIRELIWERLEDGSLSQDKVMELGEVINSERED